MKYNIRINQKALYDNHLENKLDLVDLVLFDFIHDFFNSVSKDKMVYDIGGERFVEIRLCLIQEQVPMLNITSKRTFLRRMANLVEAGLIERYENNQKENKSCYKRGPKWDVFTFYDSSAYEELRPCVIDCSTCDTNVTPYDKDVTPYDKDVTGRVTKMSHNNNIIDNNNRERETRTYMREGTGNDEAIANTFLSSDMARLMARQYKVSAGDMETAVKEVLAQWEVSEQRHSDYSDRMNHLINQVRVKLERIKSSPSNQQIYGMQQQQTFRQQDRAADIRQYEFAHEEVERRRREEQYGRNDNPGDIL